MTPSKPKTDELDKWSAFKDSQRYGDLWDFLKAVQDRKVRLEDKCDAERCTSGNRDNIISLSTTYQNYPGDHFHSDHTIDEILMAYFGIDPDKIAEDEAALVRYKEEIRTQRQKHEFLAGVEIGSSVDQ